MTDESKPPLTQGVWSKMKDGLAKTRMQLTGGLENIFLGRKGIDGKLLEELEMVLLSADVGFEATKAIIEQLTLKVGRKELDDETALWEALSTILKDMLSPLEASLRLSTTVSPTVLLFVGVNGAGKTTTLGKLAHRFKNEGQLTLLAAGDTFRAAAAEQLLHWAERTGSEAVVQQRGSDSAAVIFDAIQSARARNVNVVLADTAGRLQSKNNLMEELAKIGRVIKTITPPVAQETLLVLDGSIGQNSLGQLKQFKEILGISGLVITKLDGTAKAGILLAIAQMEPLPVYFIGVGEDVEDLHPFEAEAFVEALLARDI